MTKEKIKFNDKIDKLAMEILENSGVYREYSDEDLGNALIILSEVALAKMHACHCDKLNQEGLEKLAMEFGTSLNKTIKLFTGIDSKKIFK